MKPRVSTTDELIDIVRGLGLRATPQRIMIIDIVREGHHEHLSAEQIHERVVAQYPTVNLVSVYRTLDSLLAVGVISKTDLGDKSATYAWRGLTPEHHHLVCRLCSAVIEAPGGHIFAQLRTDLLHRYGFQADLDHLALHGICAHCAAQRAIAHR